MNAAIPIAAVLTVSSLFILVIFTTCIYAKEDTVSKDISQYVVSVFTEVIVVDLCHDKVEKADRYQVER